jgi:hypothetical protein
MEKKEKSAGKSGRERKKIKGRYFENEGGRERDREGDRELQEGIYIYREREYLRRYRERASKCENISVKARKRNRKREKQREKLREREGEKERER